MTEIKIHTPDTLFSFFTAGLLKSECSPHSEILLTCRFCRWSEVQHSLGGDAAAVALLGFECQSLYKQALLISKKPSSLPGILSVSKSTFSSGCPDAHTRYAQNE